MHRNYHGVLVVTIISTMDARRKWTTEQKMKKINIEVSAIKN